MTIDESALLNTIRERFSESVVVTDGDDPYPTTEIRARDGVVLAIVFSGCVYRGKSDGRMIPFFDGYELMRMDADGEMLGMHRTYGGPYTAADDVIDCLSRLLTETKP